MIPLLKKIRPPIMERAFYLSRRIGRVEGPVWLAAPLGKGAGPEKKEVADTVSVIMNTFSIILWVTFL